jgi:hypothetical protein
MLNGALMDFVPKVSDRLCVVWPFGSAWRGLLVLAAVQVLTLSSAAAQRTSQSAVGQSATIRGVVFSTVDSKPIPGARVSLGRNDSSVFTDDNGQFEFIGVPVGSESVKTNKPGFLCFLTRSRQQPKCSEDVDVQPGNVQVTLTMVPQAAVTGRVVDQTGKPVEGLVLCLLDHEVQNGRYAWVRVFDTLQKTNADGAFRITDLEPGTYLLLTSNKPDPKHSGNGYAAAYYPGTPNQNDATPIVIQAGDELKLTITVTDQQFQPVTLSYWNHEWKTGNGDWSLSYETDLTDWNHYANLRDSFEEDLTSRHHLYRMFAPAGEYTLQFRIYPPNDPVSGKLLPWPDGTHEPYMGSVAFTVKDQPVTLAEVPSQHPINIRLDVRSELAQKGIRKAVRRQCDDHLGTAVSFTLKDQLTHGANEREWQAACGPSNFEFKGNYPGQYILQATDVRGAYIASLTCGGTNLLREPLIVRPGVPTCSIEAVIRNDLSYLSVGFTPQAAARLTTSGVTVTGLALIPQENSLETPYSAELEVASEPEKLAIPPGTYLAVPFDGRPIAWRDPVERKRLMSLGTMVTVAPGESKSISLDWRPELIDAKIWPTSLTFGRALP